ncbi:unnamed protein product [Trifolium pratense]|uniref:Uncharacterized protein n=1 Tax=Trifolium pratense TaxID=57577 RepID=A0ACB0KQ11_TRIPR|nr:unnamed protein product [Trifolium pratense]
MAPSWENDDDRKYDAVSSDPITALPSLPFEIIEEILSKLPVKFLMQLKSVCKSWESLISDPQFAKKHLRVSTTRHHLLTFNNFFSDELFVVVYPFSSVFTELTVAASRQLDFPLPVGNLSHYIIGSCHGIICFEINEHFVFLWNRFISKFMKLPSLANPKQKICYTAYGFGYVYDQFNDNYSYKVVAVNYIESDNNVSYYRYRPQLKVYTLGTNSWRMIQDFPYCIPLGLSSGRFISGTVNWLAYNNLFISLVIVSFDLENEFYQEITLPDYEVVIRPQVTLVVLRDCLSIIAESNTYLDVWLMDEYGNTESWTKLFRIPRGEPPAYITPLYLSEDDHVLMESRYVRQSKPQSELAIYNSRDSILKTTEIQKINCSMVHEVYQESLISPCSL